MEGRKQAVSLRLNSADIKRIKRLAERLEARDSDIVRFAIKMMLSRIGPLSDPAIRGRNLVPVFAEAGAEIVGYFDLDVGQLDEIINGDVPEQERMDSEDIHLMAMVGTQKAYARVSLRKIAEENHPHRRQDDLDDSAATSLRRLLYAKYGYEGRGSGRGAVANGKAAPGIVPTPSSRTAELVAQAKAAVNSAANSAAQRPAAAADPGARKTQK